MVQFGHFRRLIRQGTFIRLVHLPITSNLLQIANAPIHVLQLPVALHVDVVQLVDVRSRIVTGHFRWHLIVIRIFINVILPQFLQIPIRQVRARRWPILEWLLIIYAVCMRGIKCLQRLLPRNAGSFVEFPRKGGGSIYGQNYARFK